MNEQTLTKLQDTVLAVVATVGLKVLAALVLFVFGRWLIGVTVRLLRRVLERQKVDPTLLRYAGSVVNVLLNIMLVVGILGYFGVQTTTFAALFAGAGVAIGMAWSGLLANFAAGVFLIVLRPFKTGDYVTVGGVTGTIREVGLFATSIDTPDNVHTLVGNNKILSDTIVNFSTNDYRRVELKAQLSGAADWRAAVETLEKKLAQIPNVLKVPKPQIEILDSNLLGPVLAVRPFCHNDHYWQVYFDTNKILKDDLDAFPAPTTTQVITLNKTA